MKVKNLFKEGRGTLAILYAILVIAWVTRIFPTVGLEGYYEHYAIPITMFFGSFLAGFTCEGGGAIAFPVFTKVLHITPDVARDFSFAIQSIGMTFASITVLLKKVKFEKNVAIHATIGGVVGIAIGTIFIVPHITSGEVKLIFTMLLLSFGIALFLKNYVLKSDKYEEIVGFKFSDRMVLIVVGFVGGIFSSIIGTGVHFIAFSFVTLLYKIDEKVATPTSVMIMACDSIFGFFLRGAVLHNMTSEALLYWKLAIPVAALMAPIGAVVCTKVSREFIVKVLLVLISAEVITTLLIFSFNATSIILAALVVAGSLVIYLTLLLISKRVMAKREALESKY